MQQPETTAVPKLVLTAASRVLRQITVDRSRLTIGRRPSNDLMLDDLTVSGEHAVLHTAGGQSVIHDLDSRNGTLVNGVPVMQRTLVDGDWIDIGIYRLQYLLQRAVRDGPAVETPGLAVARLVTLSGPLTGTLVRLDRPIVSLSNDAGQVAVVASRGAGHVITHLEGPAYPLVNGEAIGLVARALRHEDLIELAGTIFQFRTDPPP
jgi:hypothetical protein